MELIATRILHCLNYLQDIDYVAQIVNSTSQAKLCNIINELLQSQDSETVGLTCLFIRDLVISGSRHPDCDKFVQDYSKSSIIKTLENLLFSQNHFIRCQAVYTLGKTDSYSSIFALNQAFHVFRDTDPILLPRLIGEMGWLGTDRFWSLLDSMIDSPIYITRWAAIAVLKEFNSGDEGSRDELFQGKLKCIEKMRRDSNLLVQAEAEYEYQFLKFRSESYDLLKTDRKRQRKALERQYRPAVRFSYISNMFKNHLYDKGLNQYSIDELEEFISDTVKP